MKQLLITLFLFPSIIGSAQLTNGSIAPNFTLTDINGTTHTLYDYLDAGKTVFIDFWAAHCPTCWNYHNQHHVQNLFEAHGPTGTSTNDIIVFGIEVDTNNGLNEFNGISGYSAGDWLDGISYPIFNPEGTDHPAITNSYEVNYYPLVYCICSDRTIEITGTQSATNLYNHVGDCNLSIDVNEPVSHSKINYYYSEDSGVLNINHYNSTVDVKIFTIAGECIYSGSLPKNNTTIPLFGISSGVYLCSIKEKSGNTFTGKFFVN